MNILFVTHTFPPRDRPETNIGGMQRVAIDLCDALSRRQDVSVYALAQYTSWKMTHIRTPFFLARILRALPRLVAEHNVDVILFSSMVTASTAWRLNRRQWHPKPLLAAIAHGRDVTLSVSAYQRFLPHVFEALDLVMPVSRATRDACLKRELSPDKAFVIPNGVDPGLFGEPPSFDERRGVLLEGYPLLKGRLGNDHIALCSVGRHVRRKGFDWFVEHVMPALPARAHYLLAGEGETAALIESVAARLGLSHRVHQLGRISHEKLESLYHGADLFVMPNRRVEGDMEGFGVVVLEASLCGLPVLGARLEGIRDAVTEGRNGWLVESENPQEMAEAISSLIDQPEVLKMMSAETRAFAIEQHSWEGVANRMCDVLRKRLRSRSEESTA